MKDIYLNDDQINRIRELAKAPNEEGNYSDAYTTIAEMLDESNPRVQCDRIFRHRR